MDEFCRGVCLLGFAAGLALTALPANVGPLPDATCRTSRRHIPILEPSQAGDVFAPPGDCGAADFRAHPPSQNGPVPAPLTTI